MVSAGFSDMKRQLAPDAEVCRRVRRGRTDKGTNLRIQAACNHIGKTSKSSVVTPDSSMAPTFYEALAPPARPSSQGLVEQSNAVGQAWQGGQMLKESQGWGGEPSRQAMAGCCSRPNTP